MSLRRGGHLFSVYKHLSKLTNGTSLVFHVKASSCMQKQLLLVNINTSELTQRYLSTSTVPCVNVKVDTVDGISPTQMYENSVDFKGITEGDADLEKKLRVLCLEHEVCRQEGVLVPRSLNPDQWKHLLTLDSRSKRRKYYKFLFGIEIKKEKEKLKKEERAKERMESLALKKQKELEDDDNHIKYGLGHNSFLLRLYDTTMNHHYNHNLIRAMQFGQKIVIDCDYDKHMTPQETSNCGKQIMITFSENRLQNDPFDIHLCNANINNPTVKQLMKLIPNLTEDHFPLNVHSQSYLDLFPKQDLVYLTPHCRQELDYFDYDTVYIVGALVDKTNNEPLSLAKAKKEGLRMAKLPLDRYLQWSGGSGKSLTINQMLQILSEVRATESWEKAFKYVPRRKLNSDEVFSSQPQDFNKRRPFQPSNGNRQNWRKNNRFSN